MVSVQVSYERLDYSTNFSLHIAVVTPIGINPNIDVCLSHVC